MRCTPFLLAAICVTTVSAFAQQDRPGSACMFDGFGANPRLSEIAVKTTTAYYGCSAAKNCLPATLTQGDPFVIFRAEGEWTCGYFSHRDGAAPAWVRSKDFRPLEFDQRPSITAWLGTWVQGYGRIMIHSSKIPGKLHLQGNAEWHGAGGVVHTGDFAGEAAPNGNHLHFVEGDSDSCTIELTLIGKYLVADDNDKCGGMNVRFWSIWRRANK